MITKQSNEIINWEIILNIFEVNKYLMLKKFNSVRYSKTPIIINNIKSIKFKCKYINFIYYFIHKLKTQRHNS